MNTLETWLQRGTSYVLSIVRIMVAALFLEHGTQKILHFPEAAMMRGGGGMPPMPAFVAHLGQLFGPYSGHIELIVGILLLLGVFTRLAAFIASGEMAMAYFLVHAWMGYFPINNHGEMAVLYCFIFLLFVFTGAGPISVDWLFRRKQAVSVDGVSSTG